MDEEISFVIVCQAKIVSDLSTEVVGVGADSVDAVINGRYHDG